MSIAKVQHYVPQFLLRNFGVGKKDQVFVFDKRKGAHFRTNVKNIASESRFYDVTLQGKDLSLEPALSSLEGSAKKAFSRILVNDSISSVPDEDKVTIATFLAVQFRRTKHAFISQKSLMEGIKDHLLRRGEEVSQELRDSLSPSEEEERAMFLGFLGEAPSLFASHFLNKTVVLCKTHPKHPFMIGDNPLALQNMIDHSPYGNIGLAVRGIEIYFPLSPTRALAFWCPSLYESIDRARRSSSFPFLPVERQRTITSIVRAVEDGTPLVYESAHVTNFNSLQIRFAERFVFSQSDDFKLAKDMLSDDVRFMSGPRIEFA